MTEWIEIEGEWYQIHEWAEWVAQDANGNWYEYSQEPYCGSLVWGIFTINCVASIVKTTPPKDFTQELYQLERKWKCQS